ncbi:RNA-binding protein 7-like [Portunus trituberculatus]|uniref:RNA-binding protein 7-like n=1 Tax=Portunus trituberculatus TaxID=210409 RepID=UPI001E1CB7A7|nr:RNA-binding protein 7-like [Portunus trituberculatus]
MEDEESRTVWVGNFDPEVTTEEILYELFLQAGPLHYVKIPQDKTTKRSKNFGFICFRHSVSVPYAIELLNDIDVNGRNLRVQSRNHQQLQKQGRASGPGGIHSLDPNFGVAQNFSGPSQPCGQQALMQTPSLLGLPNQTIMAMAQQQMALLNAYQPIPLSANPLLNAPKERYSDRHGSISHDRNNQYMKHNSPRNNSYQQGNYSRNSPYQRNDYSNDYGKHSSYQQNASASTGRFDFNRLGPQQNRDQQQHHHHNQYRSSHSNDNHSRHGGQHNRHRSDSYHNKYDNHRNSGRHYDNRNYR